MASRKSFVFYTEYTEHLKLLADDERGRLLIYIMEYAETGMVPELAGAEKMAFSFIRAQIDRDNAKWEQTCQKRAEAGQKGGIESGKARKQNEANEANASSAKQNEANEAVDVDVDVDVDDDVDEKDITPLTPQGETPDGAGRERFTPPTVDEVAAYCQERSNGIGAEQFVDFYAAKGWFIGKNKMKDWKAAVRTWEKNHKNSADTRGQSYPEDGTPHPDGGKWYRGQQLLGV